MSEVVTGKALGTKLCEVFKLDPSRVQGMELHVDVRSVPILTVHMFVAVDQMKGIVDYMEDYELVRKVGSNGNGN